MDEEIPSSPPLSPLTSPPLSHSLAAGTPRRQTSESTSASGPLQQTRRNTCFVEVPMLSSSDKRAYKAKETMLKEVVKRVDEIIGEYREGNVLYYFARSQGGIAHKFPSQTLINDSPTVVAAYKSAKKSPNFKHANFDPSANYIHPLSRIKVKLTLSPARDRVRASISSSRAVDRIEYVPDSTEEQEEEEEEEEEGESDGYFEKRGPSRPIRETRQAKLPFSPRKSRSQHIISGDYSESERASDAPARRITRGRAIKINLGSESSGSEDDDDGSEYAVNSKPAKPKRVNRSKFQPPSYGNIRPIAAIDYDDYPSDPTNVALREHRAICEKCHLVPAHELLQTMKKKNKNGKKRKRGSDHEFDFSDDEDRYTALGGWVRCLKCPISAHWNCLASTQREEILKAAREKDKREWEAQGNDPDDLVRRKRLELEETTEFICGPCHKGGVCIGCMEDIPPPVEKPVPTVDANGDVEMTDGSGDPEPALTMARQLHFRCLTCKRMAHYEHLPIPPSLPSNSKLSKIAIYYQHTKGWLCADCASFQYPLDKIIAWRPYPATAKEIKPPSSYKEQLPREYLVKWTDRSYRRLSWVPHMWLVSTNPAKLKNFLAGGTKIELLKEIPDGDAKHTEDTPFAIGGESRASSAKPAIAYGPLDALPDAEKRILPAWKTVDRVLDVLFWDDQRKSKGKKKAPAKRTIVSDDDDDVDMDDDLPEELRLTFEQGEQPDRDLTMGPSEWERHIADDISEDDVDKVVWGFFKWDDLGYDEASWDSPPRRGQPGYDAFVTAFKRYVHSRSVEVPEVTKKWLDTFNSRPKDEFRRKHMLQDPAELELGQDPSLKLMPFQVDGFNWLCNNWWNHQPCILADDMGLGKTVQIATFLGNIATKWKAFPALVVVPNSTITNWVREFERWAPNLRVVPFYGEKKARDIIKQFELYHPKARKGYTNAKFHVLVTTYEAAINPKDFGVIFKKQPRWEALVIDEGQRLKSDSSLLFRKLNELNSAHRVIMTGTPLNNNMRELFNLMNFLDPEEWNDLEALERDHSQEYLNEETIKQLHNRLRPYFLRRIKSDVLDLPAKNEVIIPVSMAPLQRQIYRSILSHNLDLLKGLTQPKNGGAKGKLNNVLMHLRKCLQHPYLYSEDIEPRGLPPQETHDKLIDASAKLRFLKTLLPKLKARGHRVLLFSQFVLALDVVEDFLRGEGFQYLRLDGSTKGADRQKSMDEYNKPDSEIFIFLLTTRAGGVGINLFTADTVIIFDPDFNPHQDLQAIARAYRYGQKKTCLVFKLMVKDSAEERIMQIGKKKLVLDHLIVQKMDDDEDSPGENVESILTFGAQALFESDQAAKDITYSEHDIDQLIEKTEKEGDETDAPKEGASFAFAKIWSADKDGLEDVADEDQVDSWAQTLEKINEERVKDRQQDLLVSGRGARRKAADVAKTKMVYNPMLDGADSPDKQERRSGHSDASAFGSPKGSGDEDDGIDSDSGGELEDEDFRMVVENEKKAKGRGKKRPKDVEMAELPPAPTVTNGTTGILKTRPTDVVYKEQYPVCGLCGTRHGPKECGMTDKSENLAEYREMLILHADDEPWEQRSAAIRAIDEILNARGHLNLIQGQPLHPLVKATNIPPTKKPKETMEMVTASYQEKQKRVRQQMALPSTAKPKGRRNGIDVIRDYTTNALASSSGSSSTSRTQGGGVIVESRASGSGMNRMPTSTMRPYSSSPLTSLPGSGMSAAASSPMARGPALPVSYGEPCVVCGSASYHFLKDCPVVMQGPKKVSELIALFEQGNDSKKADAVVTLRRILAKQKKGQQKERIE